MNSRFLTFVLFAFFILPLSAQETAFSKMKWRAIGPANMGGRVTAVEGIPGDPTTFYIAGADGGLHKTVNGGTTFKEVFKDQKSYSVGAVKVAPSDYNVIYLGSGEGDPRNSVGYGHGVYRSTDAGESWEHLGLEKTERIKRIVVHPDNPDIACVCALGREWGPNEERGVFKTIDGGKNWKKVLYLDEDTGCSDIDIDLSNPRIMYAGMWTFRRKPWRFDGGGRETAVYKSKDGGDTWEKIMNGFPDSDMARIGVQVAQSKPNIVYVITEFKDAGSLFKSTDYGNSWKMVNDNKNINFRPFYYSDIRVDPTNENTLYSLSGGLYKSTDGGGKFDRIADDVHGDHQSFWIDPTNSEFLISGSDGGFQLSWDEGKNWDIINNIELSQFYQLDIDMLQPYNVYGGLQDNGCWKGPSNSLNQKGILKRHWQRLSYGDGYFAVPIPGSEHEVYTNLQGGVPFHVNANTGVVRSIHPFPKITGSAGDAIEDHKYRFNWDAPIHISPHDPNTVYFGGNVIFKSTDRGYSWSVISPDLTTNDKDKQRTSGGTVYQDNTAAEFHCTILYIAESPVQAGVLYAGTDDGNLHVSMDGGQNWSNVNKRLPGLPEFSWISKIEASWHDAGTAFVAVDNHRSDDFTPYAYMTTDFGKTWKKMTNGLPSDDYVKVVRQDPNNENTLVLGMEHGVYISWDKGGNWTRINNNLPPVSVRDLRIHPRERDIIVGTHGRGVWIMDDAGSLLDMKKTEGKDVMVFDVRPAVKWHMYQQIENMGQRTYIAENPKYGASIHVFSKEKPDGELVVTIKNDLGLTVRTIKDTTLIAGLNVINWDLQADEPAKLDNDEGGGWRGSFSPSIVPGTYTAEVLVDGNSFTKTIEVKADPRLELEKEDYEEIKASVDRLTGILSRTHEMINDIDALKEQLSNLKDRLSSEDAEAYKDQIEMIGTVNQELDNQRNELIRPPGSMNYRTRPRLREEILSILFAIDRVPARPTKAQQERTETLIEETLEKEALLNQTKNGPVRAINEAVKMLPMLDLKVKAKRS
ncbi:VPS10 domain-containing protein [Portibacter marinus]|uniref:VPS10 domain-containing protein n=1 Tax=Portibacter marinus TaxID=2898660 RepID=UPI001F16AB34|nr:hypothetical protein [Portibacter marinus]